ncbi:glutamine amidotransferase-related protein [Varibaculum vaginae]|uniref:glutamine amidotransferase-related protein n=1 Tax=Varibaculum vaginae TaxID=2364797 RepID=UPI000F089988|nr:gamma-glutamyl-gamma-aminobutyrate hydrolase family protein [Varibaculum vaginae]
MRERLPFLFIQCRPAGKIARDELQSVSEVTGLGVGQDLQSHLLPEESDLDLLRDLDIANAYSAVIISGSPFRAQLPNSSEKSMSGQLSNQLMPLIHYLLEQDFPTLGICYGMQMLALASGIALTDHTGEDLQAVQVRLTTEGQADPVTGQLEPIIRSYTGHGDSLGDLPGGATLLGSGKHCHYQLLRFKNNLYGTQFHPEITTAGMQIRIDQYGNAYYAAAERKAVIARCMNQDVTSSHRLLSAFTEYFRR